MKDLMTSRYSKVPALFSLIAMSAGSSMAGVYEENGIKYDITDLHTAVVSSVPVSEEIIIPGEITIGGTAYPVTEISGDACQGLKIDRLQIPPTVKRIGAEAFSNTSVSRLYINDLESWCGIDFGYDVYAGTTRVSFESSACPIGADTELFVGGERMTELIIPDDVEEIPFFAFANLKCDMVTLGSRVGYVGVKAFYNSSVERLVVGESVRSIDQEAFSGCRQLREITLSDNLSGLSVEAFSKCPVKEIRVPSLEAWLKIKYETCVLDGLYLDSPFGTGYDLYIGGTLAEDIVIPSGYETLNDMSFSGCSSLRSVTCGEGLVSTGNFTFDSCANLEHASFPSSLEEFGSIFSGKRLKTLELNSPEPPSILYYPGQLSYSLGVSYEDCVLLVPEGSIELYSVTEPWMYFNNIRAIGTAGTMALPETEGEKAVYSLQGVRLENSGHLPAGVYIIDGKKVMIRK